MIQYPKAVLNPQDSDGGSMVGGPPRAVLHTTETPRLSSGQPYYHLGFVELDDGSIYIEQWRDFRRASRALRNKAGGVQTNRQGDVCLNIVVVGDAADAHLWSDAMINELNEFANWAKMKFNIPLIHPAPIGGSNCYGESSPCRLTNQQWINYTGWCGHQNVPENTHWDPGFADWGRILLPREEEDMQLPAERRDDVKDLIAKGHISGDLGYYFPVPGGPSADLPADEWVNLTLAAVAGVAREAGTSGRPASEIRKIIADAISNG